LVTEKSLSQTSMNVTELEPEKKVETRLTNH
jgi:hypothetical protein